MKECKERKPFKFCGVEIKDPVLQKGMGTGFLAMLCLALSLADYMFENAITDAFLFGLIIAVVMASFSFACTIAWFAKNSGQNGQGSTPAQESTESKSENKTE